MIEGSTLPESSSLWPNGVKSMNEKSSCSILAV